MYSSLRSMGRMWPISVCTSLTRGVYAVMMSAMCCWMVQLAAKRLSRPDAGGKGLVRVVVGKEPLITTRGDEPELS